MLDAIQYTSCGLFLVVFSIICVRAYHYERATSRRARQGARK